jgi:hypothetical protein
LYRGFVVTFPFPLLNMTCFAFLSFIICVCSSLYYSFLLFLFFETGSCCVVQSGLTFVILLPQLSEGLDYRCVPPRNSPTLPNILILAKSSSLYVQWLGRLILFPAWLQQAWQFAEFSHWFLMEWELFREIKWEPLKLPFTKHW